MVGMMLKCVLLDANIIIESYVLGAWEKLIGQAEIFVSSVIVVIVVKSLVF